MASSEPRVTSGSGSRLFCREVLQGFEKKVTPQQLGVWRENYGMLYPT
jgi:hypothetical protein